MLEGRPSILKHKNTDIGVPYIAAEILKRLRLGSQKQRAFKPIRSKFFGIFSP
jgi:hypothetical protein